MAGFDVLVVGGGLAGAAATTLLARSGRTVALLEQHAAPHHTVCGEFLSAEALHYLGQLGVSAEALGAVPIHRVRLATRGGGVACAALPFAAVSLTRYCLDEAVLRQAGAAGACIVRGQRVEALTRSSGEGVWRAELRAELRAGQQIAAPHAMLATGKHDVRGLPRPLGRQNQLVAFKQYFTLTPGQADALWGHVELHLFPGGYAGLQPVEPDPATGAARANLCLVVDRARFRALGSRWPALLGHITAHCPLLRDRLWAATPLLLKPLALSGIPYGMLLRGAPAGEQNDEANTLWRLGDQAEVIPSFTGDGMSLALHTAFLAAACHSRGAGPAEFHRMLYDTAAPQIRRATTMSQMMVTPLAGPLIALTRPLLPLLLRQVARATRIPPAARLSAVAAGAQNERR